MGKRAASSLGAALALLVATGCRTSSDYWSFSLTRAVYGGVTTPRQRYVSTDRPVVQGQGPEAYLVLALLALPLAVDIVILPVTAVHDACVD